MNNNIDTTQMLQMMMQQRQTTKSLSYCEILSLILVALKGCGYIACNWIMPFVPLTVPFIIYIIVATIGFVKIKFNKN